MPAVGPPAADLLDREQSRESGDLFGPAVGLADCRLSLGAAVMRISRFCFSATSSRIIADYFGARGPRIIMPCLSGTDSGKYADINKLHSRCHLRFAPILRGGGSAVR